MHSQQRAEVLPSDAQNSEACMLPGPGAACVPPLQPAASAFFCCSTINMPLKASAAQQFHCSVHVGQCGMTIRHLRPYLISVLRIPSCPLTLSPQSHRRAMTTDEHQTLTVSVQAGPLPCPPPRARAFGPPHTTHLRSRISSFFRCVVGLCLCGLRLWRRWEQTVESRSGASGVDSSLARCGKWWCVRLLTRCRIID